MKEYEIINIFPKPVGIYRILKTFNNHYEIENIKTGGIKLVKKENVREIVKWHYTK